MGEDTHAPTVGLVIPAPGTVTTTFRVAHANRGRSPELIALEAAEAKVLGLVRIAKERVAQDTLAEDDLEQVLGLVEEQMRLLVCHCRGERDEEAVTAHEQEVDQVLARWGRGGR